MRTICLALALLLSIPGAIAQTGLREVTVENVCNQPIRMILMPAVAHRDWRTYGWYTVQPGTGPTTFQSQGWRISHLPDHPMYFYAEGLHTRTIWEGNETFANFGGVRYGMRRATITMSGGRVSMRLTCG